MGDSTIKDEDKITEKYPMTDYKESESNKYATGKEDEREDNEEGSGGTRQVRCENQ